MYTYKVNIARDHRHFAKVEFPQGTEAKDATSMAKTIMEAFAARKDGKRYEITLTRWSNPTGQDMEI